MIWKTIQKAISLFNTSPEVSTACSKAILGYLKDFAGFPNYENCHIFPLFYGFYALTATNIEKLWRTNFVR